MTSPLLVQEETLELTVEQDLRRNVVNKEFMVLYGNDPAKVCGLCDSMMILVIGSFLNRV